MRTSSFFLVTSWNHSIIRSSSSSAATEQHKHKSLLLYECTECTQAAAKEHKHSSLLLYGCAVQPTIRCRTAQLSLVSPALYSQLGLYATLINYLFCSLSSIFWVLINSLVCLCYIIVYTCKFCFCIVQLCLLHCIPNPVFFSAQLCLAKIHINSCTSATLDGKTIPV